MKTSAVKTPVKIKDTGAGNSENTGFIQSFQMLLEDKELVFQFIDRLPIPMEIFAEDGTSVFINRAMMEWLNIPEMNLITGKYNLLNDPVCNDQMGLRDSIQRAFHGEAVVDYDVSAPVQDLVNRGVVEEKPFEKSFTDFYLYPVKKGDKTVFVIFVCIVKKLYYGRPDLAKAKEYIDTHWLEGYDPEVVADSVNISVTQLYKIFKEHTGMTPGDYYKKTKVERIKEKLADNNLSIKEAFAACGEDSQGRIARVFKKIIGMSPSEYRKSIL